MNFIILLVSFFSLKEMANCQFGSAEKYNLTATNEPKPTFDENSLFEKFSELKSGDHAYSYSKALIAENATIGRRFEFLY